MAAAAGLLAGCASTKPVYTTTISHRPFGKTPDGTPVDLYTLRNANGAEAQICNYGGIVISLKVPDRNGKMGDVVLGYDNLDDYLKNSPYFGCLVGRYGNRIAKGKFTLERQGIHAGHQQRAQALHGGLKGFDKVVWNAQRRWLSRRPRPGTDLPQQGRRGRLSRQPHGERRSTR